MYKLKLKGKECISCGICKDVCLMKAIDMRIHKGKTIEGSTLAYLSFDGERKQELIPEQMMTFPFMANAEDCDGCMICVNECPTSAIDIVNDIEFNNHHCNVIETNELTYVVESSIKQLNRNL